jgi:hypothetical protein
MQEPKLQHAFQKITFLDMASHLAFFLNSRGMKSFFNQYRLPTSSLVMTVVPVSRSLLMGPRRRFNRVTYNINHSAFGRAGDQLQKNLSSTEYQWIQDPRRCLSISTN